MIYAIYQYGLRMEAVGFLDMYMFWHLQFSVSVFAIFGDSLYRLKIVFDRYEAPAFLSNKLLKGAAMNQPDIPKGT